MFHHDIVFRWCLFFVFIHFSVVGLAQYSWDVKDPNDFNFIDFGDNKLIGYNLIGLGLALLLDDDSPGNRSVERSLSAGFIREYDREPLSTLLFLEGRIGKPIRNYLIVGGGGRFYATRGADLNTVGFGGFAWFTWRFLHSGSWSIGYTNGVGPNVFFSAFPSGGTNFNFTTHYGIEVERKIGSRWLNLQLINWHISNADIKGRDRNPALDGIGIQVGVRF